MRQDNMARYHRLMLRILDADERLGGMRLSPDDVMLLKMSIFDDVTREDLVARLREPLSLTTI